MSENSKIDIDQDDLLDLISSAVGKIIRTELDKAIGQLPVSESGYDPEHLLNDEEAAPFLGVEAATLPAWRTRGKGPAYIRVGRLPRYRFGDIVAYNNSKRVVL